MADHYTLVRSVSSAGDFHGRAVPVPARSEVWHHEITAPALVLGSTQRDEVADHEACRRAGVEVVRRRSGGGAVLLVPGEVTWIDVIVPRDSVGWATDIHRPMRWLGEHLAAGLTSLIATVAAAGDVSTEVTVHGGAMAGTPWSAAVCFDGFGPGEVLLAGAKLVGISQRRTREAARLQCCWYSRYDPELLVSLLAAPFRPPLEELAPVATVPWDVASALPGLLLERLNKGAVAPQ